MNWKRIQIIIACIALPAWVFYTLQTGNFTSNGFHKPSPDKTMSASIMRVHRNPMFGKEQDYYEISIFDEYTPEKIHVKPISKEKLPLQIAYNEFELKRECIQWNMQEKTVTFDFDKTKIKRTWKD